MSMGPFPLLAVTAVAPVSPTQVFSVVVQVWGIIITAAMLVIAVEKHLGKPEDMCSL